jgi:hypothetical protein
MPAGRESKDIYTRTGREIGVRVGLGSTPGQVGTPALTPIAAGPAAGALAAWLAAGAVTALLYGLGPRDLRGRRATAVDPIVALRIESACLTKTHDEPRTRCVPEPVVSEVGAWALGRVPSAECRYQLMRHTICPSRPPGSNVLERSL